MTGTRRDLLLLFALLGWALAVPRFGSEFAVSLALSCLMYVALASSWSLFCGSTRYLSLATAAFFGIGAYTSAIGMETTGWWGAIAASALVAALVAVLMGAAVLHLRGTYFAVLTFGMTELIRHAVTWWEKQVTGTVGRVLVAVPERDTIYGTVLGLAALAVLTSIAVRRSRLGLAMAGIGADEQRAQTLGVNTRAVKIAGFALTAAFAGAVGAAMSVRWTYIDPATVFNPFIGFQTVLIALIGGAATLWGPLIAAVVFSLLAETLRLQAPQVYMMALGLLLILCVLYLPGGLASLRWSTLAGWRDGLRRAGRRLWNPAAGQGGAVNGHPLLEAREVSVRFGGLVAVDRVSAAFAPGELVGIIGPNGAGKTTFFNALSGVVAPTGGALYAQGRRLTGAPPHHYARQGVARTFQTPRVFAALDVAANIGFGLQFAGRRRQAGRLLQDAASILGLIGLADQAALPAAAITPSQQRLLEIGMALATRPRLLLLDEVAAGLTEAEVEAMAQLVRRLRDELELSVIWIEHAVGTLLRHVERVIVLHQGRKIADGTPAEVVRHPEVVEAYLGDEMVALG